MKKIFKVLILIASIFIMTDKSRLINGGEMISSNKKYLTKENTIKDLLSYPDMEKFSKFILPLEWGYNSNTKLKDIEQMLPYHQNIKLNLTLNAINYMIDKTKNGDKIFFDIYTKHVNCNSKCHTKKNILNALLNKLLLHFYH